MGRRLLDWHDCKERGKISNESERHKIVDVDGRHNAAIRLAGVVPLASAQNSASNRFQKVVERSGGNEQNPICAHVGSLVTLSARYCCAIDDRDQCPLERVTLDIGLPAKVTLLLSVNSVDQNH